MARSSSDEAEEDEVKTEAEMQPNSAGETAGPGGEPATSVQRPESDDSEEGLTDEKKPGMRLQNKWEDMFNRLLAYRDKHGDCLVPNRYNDDPQLGSWVSTQRRHYKILNSGGAESTPMTPERARRLEEAGFKWSTKDPRHVPWEQRFGELVDFQKRFGHSQVPIGWEENIQLSNWVSTQRQEYKLIQRGRQSRLTADRIKQLDDINFVWEAQRGGPRRKRKATVQVPSKANPVEARARAAKSNRGARGGGFAGKGESNVPAARAVNTAAVQGFPLHMAQMVQHIPMGMPAIIPSAMSAGQWSVMPNGAFQQPVAVAGMQGMNQAVFPIAAQWPMNGGAGFQFGMVPVWANARAPAANAGISNESESSKMSRESGNEKSPGAGELDNGQNEGVADEEHKGSEDGS